MTRAFGASVTAVVAFALVARPAAAAEKPRVVYGGDAAAVPYESVDAQGRPQGFNVELLRALGQRAGVEIEFRFDAWARILERLDAGEIDLVSMAYSDERSRRYDLLAETWTLRQALFYPVNRTDPPQRLDQLGAETVAVPEGAYMHDLLASLPEAQRPLLRPVASVEREILLLRRGEVTAIAANSLLVRSAAENAGLHGLQEVPVKAVSYQLAAQKGRAASLGWVAPALDALRQSGEHTRLIERHLTAQPFRSWREYLPLAASIVALLLVGFGGAVAWNRSLRGQVQRRTRELRESVSLLRSAFESTADGLLVVDANGKVSAFNERFGQMWRIPPALLASRDDAALLAHVLDQLVEPERFLSRVRELYAHPFDESNDLLEFKDGRVFERYSLPQRLDGEAIGRVWSFRDISARRRGETEQARLQESVRRSQTMAAMGALVAGVAHEVRNPLFNISSTLDAFEVSFSSRPGDQRLLDTLRRELYRLGNLMSDLLEYGKPSELDLRPGSIADAARDAVAFCEGLAARASVRLSFSEERTPLVLMDRARLAQVFQNLIQNAIQHSPAGGEVWVRASVAQAYPDEASCSVRDAGAGFTRADLPRVFEPFFTRRRGGTGLGLSLVQRVVELHGGSVVAGNHAEGGGLLTVRMPGLKTSPTGANIHTHGGS